MNVDDNNEFKIFHKTENMENTNYVENKVVDRNLNNLSFLSDILFIDQFTFINFNEIPSLEVNIKNYTK